MKITVCELNDEPTAFLQDWERVMAHVKNEANDLILLPEMAFYPWFGWTRQTDPAVWDAAVAALCD